nr:PREDICTED: microtubule-associated protein futsch isoform X3 [Bemisia tabaci]
MIGTFWNLCRACPSMPIDKLHSEYQSTYRWYEYRGPIQEVVNKPPQPVANGSAPVTKETTVKIESNEPRTTVDVVDAATARKRVEPALPRRRKNPELAYKTTHRFISTMNEERDKVPNDIPAITSERARSEERGGAKLKAAGSSRRSRSEGPPNATFRLRYGRGRARTRLILRNDSDEGAKHERTNGPASAAFRNAVAKISTEYRLQFAWPREGEEHMSNGKPPAGMVVPEPGLGPPRKSISMGTIKANQSNIAPVHRKKNAEVDRKDGQSEAEPPVTESKNEDLREYKTEYKKKFRPFSHYDYVGGRFLQKEASDEKQTEVSIPTDSTWYKEVLELRQKADEYKHRGWGVELLNESETDSRHLWEQVQCRSSLLALSLASTTPRSGVKEEKAPKKVWPTRTAWSRTTTPHQRDRSVTHNKEERSQSRVRGTRDNAAKLHIRSAAGRSKSVDPGISETKSPRKTPRSPVPQANAKSAKPHSEAKRPTTLTTTAPSRLKSSLSTKKSKDDLKDKNSAAPTAKSPGQPVKKRVDTSKKGAESEKKEDEEPTSLIDEPIVKSPPEPTRVKSPEQMMMRSPEPVNWTVPLDTGKTFTVTQNVQGEALARLQGESIPTTTPHAHSQVSSGNSLSLESLEVCKIMDLSLSNDNLDHHFEPLNVSSPVPREALDQVNGGNDLCQTAFETNDATKIESQLSRSKRSVLSPVENLTDFEKFNNVVVDDLEVDKYSGNDFDSNERGRTLNDSGFEKEEERQLNFSAPVSPEKSVEEMDEILEKEKLDEHNGNISEGYVSVDKASNEMNDSFNSYEDIQDPKPNAPFENAAFHRSNSDLSENLNQSLGKYSVDDETESFKLDTGHFTDLEHESIFTKEDLMSEKNASSLDGSELNYPLSMNDNTVVSNVEKAMSVHADIEMNDDRDSDSIDSVIDTAPDVTDLTKEVSAQETEACPRGENPVASSVESDKGPSDNVIEDLTSEFIDREVGFESNLSKIMESNVGLNEEKAESRSESSVTASLNFPVGTSPDCELNDGERQDHPVEIPIVEEKFSNEDVKEDSNEVISDGALFKNLKNDDSEAINFEGPAEAFKESGEIANVSLTSQAELKNMEDINNYSESFNIDDELNVQNDLPKEENGISESEIVSEKCVFVSDELNTHTPMPVNEEFEVGSLHLKDITKESANVHDDHSEANKLLNGLKENSSDSIHHNAELDDTEDRYAVVSTPDLEETPSEIPPSSSEKSLLSLSTPHLDNSEGTRSDGFSSDNHRASPTPNFEHKFTESEHNLESLIVPSSVPLTKENPPIIGEFEIPSEIDSSSQGSPPDGNETLPIEQNPKYLSDNEKLNLNQEVINSENNENSHQYTFEISHGVSAMTTEVNHEETPDLSEISNQDLAKTEVTEQAESEDPENSRLGSGDSEQKVDIDEQFLAEGIGYEISSEVENQETSDQFAVGLSSTVVNGFIESDPKVDENNHDSPNEDDASDHFSKSGFPSIKDSVNDAPTTSSEDIHSEEELHVLNSNDSRSVSPVSVKEAYPSTKGASLDFSEKSDAFLPSEALEVVDKNEEVSNISNEISVLPPTGETLKTNGLSAVVPDFFIEQSDTVLYPEALKTNGFGKTNSVTPDIRKEHVFQDNADTHLDKQSISVQNFFSDFKTVYTAEHLNGEQLIRSHSPSNGGGNFEFEAAQNISHS